MAVFSFFYTTLNGYNSLDIQDNDIKVYIFKIPHQLVYNMYRFEKSQKFSSIHEVAIFGFWPDIFFANDDQFAKINPHENLLAQKLIDAKIYKLKR